MTSQTSRPIGGFSLITMFAAGFVIAGVLAFVVGWLVKSPIWQGAKELP